MSIDVDEIIKALAYPLRRQILEWLKHPEISLPGDSGVMNGAAYVGQISLRAGLSQSTISGHLLTLQRVGLVTCRKLGQWHFFTRNEAVIQAFLAELNSQL